ncbi:MAG: hypothetical protein J7621_18900 [Niastella sp.]|nr:hypothetical protein [Niastella sp.]
MFRISTLLLVIVICAAACSTGNKASSPKVSGDIPYERMWDIVYLAWNEDTELTWQFSLYKDDRFLYTINRRENDTGVIRSYFYEGKVRNSTDTLYLTYKKDRPTEKITDFMVKEMSGNYLIQHFTDTTKRVFLRCLRRDARHGVFW